MLLQNFVVTPAVDAKKTSLVWTIGLFYSLLAAVNISFFSVMIFENQSDLLLRNFKFQSKTLAEKLQQELSLVHLSKGEPQSYDSFERNLKFLGTNSYKVFGENGEIWISQPKQPSEENISPEILSEIKQLADSSGNFVGTPYKTDLDETNFSIRLLIPFRSVQKEPLYLLGIASLPSIRERVTHIFAQMAIAIFWGIVFHGLFGYYLYRRIFKKIGILKNTSHKMYTGDLSSRVAWNFKNQDELDDLGQTFNAMASQIDSNMERITKLNREISKELAIGKEVQQMFLPSKIALSRMERYNLSIYYRPLREVSGDLYKFYRLGSGKDSSQYFFLADASGHGVSAALVTVVLGIFTDAVSAKYESPEKTLSRLSDLIGTKLQSSFFATALLLRLYPSGTLEVCNAAHNEPMILRPSSDEIRTIPTSGPPMGTITGYSYELVRMKVAPGDKILMYTDGLVETMGADGTEFGLQRVQEYFLENKNKSCKEIVDGLSFEFEKFAARFRDDVSILAFEIPK
ncbi:SpoIIE family protein phosphatase [Leptospira johnsonii]|uniref:Stage II sporulation protein E n=1 Tax=Leptospira johnsonii TaxID=1917820 RepID=A0A2P2D0D2_9LEPT|nr:SpoIIE family protein phosphatase [Leptospira johnsonii]GBF38104.1 stage II sporulation protein E [Leptospira johnsonii]